MVVKGKLRLSIHVAFAAASAGGNRAGVVLSNRALPTERMGRVARGQALPTVAFGVSGDRGEITTRLFTDRGEIAACGHASAAVAAELYRTSSGELDRVRVHSPGGGISFALAGPLRRPQVSMTVPVGGWMLEPAPDRLSRLLRVPLDDAVPPARVETGLTHLIVAVNDRDSLDRMPVDHESWRRFGHDLGVDTIGVAACSPDGRVELRDICAPIGDTEEAASGTTASAVSWHLFRLGWGDEFDISQGVAMGRPSRLQTSVADGDVTVRGQVRWLSSSLLEESLFSEGGDGRSG